MVGLCRRGSCRRHDRIDVTTGMCTEYCTYARPVGNAPLVLLLLLRLPSHHAQESARAASCVDAADQQIRIHSIDQLPCA